MRDIGELKKLYEDSEYIPDDKSFSDYDKDDVAYFDVSKIKKIEYKYSGELKKIIDKIVELRKKDKDKLAGINKETNNIFKFIRYYYKDISIVAYTSKSAIYAFKNSIVYKFIGSNKLFDVFGDNYEKVKCEIIAIVKLKNIEDNVKKTRILDKIKSSLLVKYNSNIAEKYINCISEFIPKGENTNICYVYKLEEFIFVYPKELDQNELVQVLKHLYKIDINTNNNYNIKLIDKYKFYFDIECILILDSYNLKNDKIPYFVDVFISPTKCSDINKHLKDSGYKKFTNEIEFNIILNRLLLDDKKKNRLEYNLNYKIKDNSIANEEKKIVKVIKKKEIVDKIENKDEDILTITINKLIKNHLSKNKDNSLKITDIYVKIKELSKYELLNANQQKMLTKVLILKKLKTYKWFIDNFRGRFGGHRNILLNYKLI
jgi:hypothetical protein